MRFRTTPMVLVFALLVAACGAQDSVDDTTTTAEEPTTTTSSTPVTTEETAEAVLLSYSLETGSTFTYEVAIDQQIDIVSTGDPAALGDEEIPAEATVNLAGTTVFTHTVAAGPNPGTYEVTISGDVSDMSVSGVIDGDPVDSSQIPDFADIGPIDVTIVVDEQGNLINEDGVFGGDLGGELGFLGGFGDLTAPGIGPERWVGPPLALTEVGVGDEWSDTIETATVLGDGDPIVTTIDNKVTGTDTIDGQEVFVIETFSVTSPIEFDLGEFLVGLFATAVPETATEEERAELEALTEGLHFLMSIEETVANMTTWFDAVSGYARRVDLTTGTGVHFDITMPDEATGELVDFGMEMSITQDVRYTLVGTESA